jgi:type I restriction enzyme, S subunit
VKDELSPPKGPFTLPPSWQWIRLGDLDPEFQNGESSRGHPAGDATPVLRLADIKRGRIMLDAVRRVPLPASSRAKYCLDADDILVIRVNGSRDLVGSFVSGVHGNLIYCDHFIRMRVRTELIHPAFVMYLGKWGFVRRQVEGSAVSTAGQLTINQRQLRSFVVPLPPLVEQERIVAAIEEQFSRLDAAVAALERVQQHLMRMRAAVLQAAVTGCLTPVDGSCEASEPWDTEDSLASRLTGENERKVARAHSDLLGGTWKIPTTWRWKSAAELCVVITNGDTPPPSSMTANQGDVPYVKVYNLTDRGTLNFSVRPTYIDRFTHAGPLKRSRLLPGDILTNIVGPPLGKVSVVPTDYPEWNTNQAVVVFRPLQTLHPKLLKYWLLSAPVLKLLKSTSRATAGQFNVSLTSCRALPLPIPPRTEQTAIIVSIEEHLFLIESQEMTASRALNRAQVLRSSILAAAFSGKLVPQDPVDEPASILLERIAIERTSPIGHRSSHKSRGTKIPA